MFIMYQWKVIQKDLPVCPLKNIDHNFTMETLHFGTVLEGAQSTSTMDPGPRVAATVPSALVPQVAAPSPKWPPPALSGQAAQPKRPQPWARK
ncbi:hypothetical protein UY3_00604 [Chelonia mydas]|uniref:Uncharacterized protein n=1 Tax=Chelonia mydas TaxID=8469 RepID=M7BWJ9_CHEMY|nr:hypothetical protein UY3_00604 [Chelonia mydas]